MEINKTVKLYINGEFARTESGRSYPFYKKGTDVELVRLCQSSRKDFRNSIVSNKGATKSWSSKTAYNRSQILYRMAEMAQTKAEEFEALFEESLGMNSSEAKKEVQEGIDTFVYYAGFCDKYQQVLGAVNPVAGPYHNFTTPEPVGEVALICEDDFSFPRLIDQICSILVGGNSVTALLGTGCPTVLGPLAEVFATSDLPKGVVNLLTGDLEELKDIIATHWEVRSLSFQNENKSIYHEMREQSADNMKRIVPRKIETKNLKNILDFVEMKTVWHPIGI